MSSIKYSSLHTPVGPFHIIIHTQNEVEFIKAAGFGELHDLQKRLPASLQDLELDNISSNHSYVRKVQAYFRGNMQALEGIRYEQTGGVFAKKVWRTLLTIAPGKTISYKELAMRVGSPAAIRAAGTACGQNNIMILVPCHRVIKSDGQLGNYAYGTSIKSWLLAHEEKTMRGKINLVQKAYIELRPRKQ